MAYFEKHIRPVLVEHCYECHSEKSETLEGELRLDVRAGLLRGGESGAPSVVPGQPGKSLLIKALKHEDSEMPPDEKLPDAVIARFEHWIKIGAPDPRNGDLKPLASYDFEKAREFWSLKKPVRHKLPQVRDASWPRDDLDHFVLASLEAKDLAPAAPATRSILVRRLYIDLVGLPPTPEQIAEFLADSRPDATERLVDRLLASPQFGERWGRHWLDVVRYAETSGGGRSLIFKNAWRYRDYVIDAFNKDKPFDRFVTEQVAGDLLPHETPEQRREQIIATGFLTLGPTNYELQDKELLRVEVVDEQINTIGQAFLGLALGCCRCHDSKTDPIPTADYYALAGILGSTKSLIRGNVSSFIERPLPGGNETHTREISTKIERLTRELKTAKQELPSLQADVTRLETLAGVKSRKKSKGVTRTLAELEGVVVDDEQAERKGDWKHSTFSPNHVGKGYVHDENKDHGQKSITFRPDLPSSGEYEVRIAYNGSDGRASNVPVTVTTGATTKTLVLNQSKVPADDPLFFSLGRFTFEKGRKASVTLSNTGTNGYVIADAVQFLPAFGSAESKVARPRNAARPSAKVSAQQRAELKQKRAAVAKLNADVKKRQADLKKQQTALDAATEKAMSVEEEEQPADWNLLIRGVVRNFGPVIRRRFLSVIEMNDTFEIGPDQSGRLQLAAWLTSRENPLTARVIVNRTWHHLFGRGLVRTTDDFGTTGAPPTHPELLDQLTIDFVEDGWSIKRLIRRIVLAKTYQMAYVESDRAEQIDHENSLLWRSNRRRLQAETIRDAMLAVSGELDTTLGGSTFSGKEFDYQFNSTRRSIYVPVLRNRRHDLLAAFDFPNANLVSGQRNTSTVPTQALYLMNSPFAARQSHKAAERLLDAGNSTDQQRLARASLQTLGRPPTESERSALLEFVKSGSTPPVEAWAQVYHVLFASIDFRYAQ